MPIGRPVSLTPNVKSKKISVTATASQTSFTVAGGYRVNNISVYRNGARLAQSSDFTASDGATVTLLSAATAGDIVAFEIFDDFNIADAIQGNASNQTIEGNLTVSGTLSATLENNEFTGFTTVQSLRVGYGASVAGIVTASSYRGDGSQLTGLQAGYFVETQAGIHTLSSVGIGTTNPADILDVAGAVPQIRLTDTSDTSYGQIRANGGNLALRADEGDDIADSVIVCEIDGTEVSRFTADGKLGIGSFIPKQAIDIMAADPVLRFTDSSPAGVYSQIDGAGGDLIIQADGGNQSGDSYIGFCVDNSTERMRVNSGGTVGINSTAPQYTLDVFGTGTGPIFRAFTSSASDSTPIQIQGNSGLYMRWKPAESGGAKHNWAIGCQQNVDNGFEITPSTAADGTTFSTPGLVVDKDGNVYPGADVNGDLGRPAYRWANIYTADMQLSNEGSQNEIDGTWGNYTIQEGADDLFLINRRTGKKYKFMLEEVQ